MIQRIQTLYLLLVALLATAMLFLPLAVIRIGDAYYKLDASGLNTMAEPSELQAPMWALMAVAAIIALIAFVAIFLFRRRLIQIRLCIYNSLLLIGFYALTGYYIWKLSAGQSAFGFTPQIALAFPLVALILNYLAIRNIGADEALVRSLERLR